MATDTAPPSSSIPALIIEPPRGLVAFDIRDLWLHRDLLYFLAWRDVKVRYKQTVLGVSWAILQPLLTMAVFSLFFGRLGKMPSDGLPYPIFTLAGLLPWQLFQYALTNSSQSVVAEARLITKVYFPRTIIPIASVLAGVIDFCLSFGLMAILMLYYGLVPKWTIVAIPLATVVTLMSALGAGFWLAALNVKYRDVRYTLPFISQFWMFLSPVAYASSIVPEKWYWLYALNPMAGMIDVFRWAILGTAPPLWGAVLLSGVMAFAMFTSGLMYFRAAERNFADLV